MEGRWRLRLSDLPLAAWRRIAKQRITHSGRSVALVDDAAMSQSALVLSSGRSGSTLLLHVLNWAGARRLVFEPFQSDMPRASSFAFRYLRPDDDRPELIEHMAAVLGGELRAPWVDQLNQPRRYSGRIVKCIRANLAAKWISRHFPEVPIIFLVRHPFAVSVSALRQGWTLPVTIERDPILRECFPMLRDIDMDGMGPFERNVYWWCVENYVPLAELDPSGYLLVFFESLLASPGDVLPRLFAHARIPYDRRAEQVLARPSETTKRRRFEDCLRPSYWTETVSAEKCARGERLLQVFGLDRLYRADAVAARDDAVRAATCGATPLRDALRLSARAKSS